MDSQLKNIDRLKDTILPFLLAVGFNGKIMSVGKGLIKLIGEDIHYNHVDDYFNFSHPNSFNDCINITNENKLIKTQIKNKTTVLKGNAHIYNKERIILFLFVPIFSDQDTLTTSGLTLSDFPENSVMAEYLFLIESKRSGLEEANKIIANFQKQNKDLQKSYNEVENISRLPSENPNPVIRINDEGIVIYANESSLESFLDYLDLKLGDTVPDSFNILLNQAYSSRNGIFDKTIELGPKTYSITIIKVANRNYFNLYALETTNSKNEIHQEKNQLQNLQSELNLVKDNLEETISFQTSKLELSKIDSLENLKQVAIIQNIFLDNSSNLDDLEIFFKPKHIASADFFLIEPTDIENYIYVVVGDCVGHGLPGAFLSIFFANEVKNALKKYEIDSSLISIFNKIEHNVFSSEFYSKIDSFTSTDFTIIRINTITKNVEFASNNQNFISYDSTINEIYEPTNDTTFAGIKSRINSKKIKSGNFNAQNKQLILFSDGIINQFGGEKQKKLKRRYLYQWITSSKVFKENKCFIEELFNNYKDKEEQTDDCVWLSFKI